MGARGPAARIGSQGNRPAASKKKIDRDSEEIRYAFDREKKLAREAFDDEKGRMERELQLKRETMERELTQREQSIAQREEELESLRQRAAAFPEEMDEAISRATSEAAGRAQQQAESKLTIATKEFEGERGVLLSRIEAAEKSLKEQLAQNAKLLQQIDKSYAQVQEIAVKAIEGSSNTQTLTGLQQWLADQGRRQAKAE